MSDIKSLFQTFNLGKQKDTTLLENGEGFVANNGCAITPMEPAEFIAVLNFKQDVPRGNHFHKRKIEYIIPIQGKILCKLRASENKNLEELFVITPGTGIKILPGCIHTFTAIENDAVALEYSPQKYEEDDVITVNCGST